MWEELVSRYGEYGLWERMRPLKSFRAYYQKWPFDDREKTLTLGLGDYYDEWSSDELSRIADELDFECNLSSLTAIEQTVARKLVEGYKPRHIAKLLGHPNSGVIRQVKFQMKTKLTRS